MSICVCDHADGQFVCGHGLRFIFRMPRQKRLGLCLTLMRFQRAGRKNQSTAGFHPFSRAVQHRALDRSEIVDRFQVDTLQHIGVPPHRTRGAARRIEQNRVKQMRRFPVHHIGVDAFRI